MIGKKLMNDNQRGLVIWLTGLPCSGKTTISKEIEKYFRGQNLPVQRLDGDVVRGTINSDLSFSKKDRDENIRRVTHIAKMLSDNGVNVVVAFVSPYQKMRKFAREICPNFVEVYLQCNVGECQKRDNKGMYKKALAGKIKDFTGVQDPYEEPVNPEVVVNTEDENIEESVGRILEYLKK